MRLYRTLLAAALAAGLLTSPAMADRKREREQDRAFDATREGRIRPLPELRQRVMPIVGRDAEPLSPEMIGRTYRMKFMRDGRVIWVDVDPRTGRVLRTSE
jgi:cobalamin biosynthesis protein CobD/CbiB